MNRTEEQIEQPRLCESCANAGLPDCVLLTFMRADVKEFLREVLFSPFNLHFGGPSTESAVIKVGDKTVHFLTLLSTCTQIKND